MKTINRLVLNKFQATDFDLYYLLVGNDKVMEMITERALLRTEALERYEKIMLNNQIHPAFGYYKIIDSDSGNFMGFAKMQVTDPNPEEAELGYVLLPDYWGKGIGSTVAKILMDRALSEKSLKKINAIIDPKNQASRKILTNNGFISEKIVEMDGLPVELFAFSISAKI